MSALRPIRLDAALRGDEFSYSSVLTGGWTQASFTSLKFTLRDEVPPSSTTDDADAIDQATSDASEITFQDSTHFTVAIPASRTAAWPLGPLYWDLSALDLSGKPHTLARGDVRVFGDITRSQ